MEAFWGNSAKIRFTTIETVRIEYLSATQTPQGVHLVMITTDHPI